MAGVLVTSRLTSKDLLLRWLPLSLAPATHVQHLYFDSAVDGGTFKLWVNGEVTAAIAITGTAATDVGSINSALDALPNLTAGEIVASGSAITDITLTASGNKFFVIKVFEEALTQTTPNTNDKLITEVTTQGSDWVQLSAEATSFSWEETAETTDVTALSEEARTEIPVARAASFDVNLFKAQEVWQVSVVAGYNGVLEVYPEGRIVGNEYYSFLALIESAGEDFPDHDKIEIAVSGMRQGDWIVPPQTIWRG